MFEEPDDVQPNSAETTSHSDVERIREMDIQRDFGTIPAMRPSNPTEMNINIGQEPLEISKPESPLSINKGMERKVRYIFTYFQI